MADTTQPEQQKIADLLDLDYLHLIIGKYLLNK